MAKPKKKALKQMANKGLQALQTLSVQFISHLIEEGAKRRAPKYMEWYSAFGLLVTLVWLYIEILRLLSRLRSR